MRKLLVGVAVALVCVACTSNRPNVLPTSSGTPTPTPSDASDLAKLLPDKAPDGFTLVAEQSGPLSLDEAAARDPDPKAEKKRLVQQGFLRGYARTWESVAGDVIIVILSEFGSDAGAKAELENSITDANQTGATRFDVPGIDGAAGLTQHEEGGDIFHAVAFARGRHLFVAAIGGPPGHEPAESIELAQKIVALL